MPTFRYIKIVDNNNPSDFIIDVTQMQDYRMRVSALRTQCIRHHYHGIGSLRPIYKYFFQDYSFYMVHKAEFPNLRDARMHRQQVMDECLRRRQGIYEQNNNIL